MSIPPPGTTVEDESYFTICMHSDPPGPTTASMVAVLPEDLSQPWPVWISFAVPCSGVFIPVYSAGVLPAVMARGGNAPEPATESLWWKFQGLQLAAAKNLERNIPLLRDAWKPFEEDVERERKVAEEEAARLGAAGDEHGASQRLTCFMEETVARAVQCVDEFTGQCG